MRGHRARLVVAVLAAALALAACGTTTTKSPSKPADNGVAAKDAQQILSDATAAFRGVSSVHLVGTFSDNGDSIGIDLRIGKAAARGSVKVSGAELQVLSTGGKFYLKGRQFWQKTAGAQAANLIGDRWVLAPATATSAADFSDFKKLVDLSAFADDVLKPTGTISKGQSGSVNGQPALALKDSDESSLWIATTGSPFPLRIEPKPASATSGEKLDFRDYNAPVTVAAPTDVLDISKLQGG